MRTPGKALSKDLCETQPKATVKLPMRRENGMNILTPFFFL